MDTDWNRELSNPICTYILLKISSKSIGFIVFVCFLVHNYFTLESQRRTTLLMYLQKFWYCKMGFLFSVNLDIHSILHSVRLPSTINRCTLSLLKTPKSSIRSALAEISSFQQITYNETKHACMFINFRSLHRHHSAQVLHLWKNFALRGSSEYSRVHVRLFVYDLPFYSLAPLCQTLLSNFNACGLMNTLRGAYGETTYFTSPKLCGKCCGLVYYSPSTEVEQPFHFFMVPYVNSLEILITYNVNFNSLFSVNPFVFIYVFLPVMWL